MLRRLCALLAVLVLVCVSHAAEGLKAGDNVAIVGDSITEQKLYSVYMEDYLLMCKPAAELKTCQFGWSGETSWGFVARMNNDVSWFHPTVATTCYGMNDHEYRAYQERIGQAYRSNSMAIVEAFKAAGARVIQGSPGCVGKVPAWTRSTNSSLEDLNLNLCNLRNIGIEVARAEQAGFADVFWPMLTAGVQAQKRYGTNYAIAGRDGVHPGWAGHLVMAYAFLKALGLDGEIGTFTVDLGSNKMTASKGHEVVKAKDGEFEIKSGRYPFCVCEPSGQAAASYPVCGSDDPAKDSSIRSALMLVAFQQELSRLTLLARKGKAQSYKVTWGSESKTFSAEQLAGGVNLAEEFPLNPFSEAFAKVDAAVAAKQAYETKQIKGIFHGPDGKADMEAAAAKTEKEREALVEAIKAAFVPVTHRIRITAQ